MSAAAAVFNTAEADTSTAKLQPSTRPQAASCSRLPCRILHIPAASAFSSRYCHGHRTPDLCNQTRAAAFRGNDHAPNAAAAFVAAEDGEQTDAILLDVGGMKCGGCSAAVKRLLAARPEVQAASVNLVTGSAVVALHSAAEPTTADQLGELLTAKVG
jgi:copper chaperone CopZ